MDIVIKISEEAYNTLKTKGSIDWLKARCIMRAIANGTPLPKGHGDLYDVNELNEFASNHKIGGTAFDGELIYDAGETDKGDTIYKPVIDELTVVIKADKVVEDGDNN